MFGKSTRDSRSSFSAWACSFHTRYYDTSEKMQALVWVLDQETEGSVLEVIGEYCIISARRNTPGLRQRDKAALLLASDSLGLLGVYLLVIVEPQCLFGQSKHNPLNAVSAWRVPCQDNGTTRST